jgi:hypothetical protein
LASSTVFSPTHADGAVTPAVSGLQGHEGRRIDDYTHSEVRVPQCLPPKGGPDAQRPNTHQQKYACCSTELVTRTLLVGNRRLLRRVG